MHMAKRSVKAVEPNSRGQLQPQSAANKENKDGEGTRTEHNSPVARVVQDGEDPIPPLPPPIPRREGHSGVCPMRRHALHIPYQCRR